MENIKENLKAKAREKTGIEDPLKMEELERLVTYLKAMPQVDISEFPMKGKNGFIKKIIWKLLGFYTYRLFVQQNEINSRIIRVIDLLHEEVKKLK